MQFNQYPVLSDGEIDVTVAKNVEPGLGIKERYIGNRYAAKACLLIRRIAKDHGMFVLWITCNPDNTASRRTCEIVGSEFVEIVDLPADCEDYRKGDRRRCWYKWRI